MHANCECIQTAQKDLLIFKKKCKDPYFHSLSNFCLFHFQEQAAAIEKGKAKLQMPPVMKVSQLKPDLISDNPNLDQLNKCKFVFTDISLDIPHKVRIQFVFSY